MRLHFIISMIIIGLIFSGCTGSGDESVEYVIEKVDENGKVYYELNEDFFPKNIEDMTLDSFEYINSTVSITNDDIRKFDKRFEGGYEVFVVKYNSMNHEYTISLRNGSRIKNDISKDIQTNLYVNDNLLYVSPYEDRSLMFIPNKNDFDFAIIGSSSEETSPSELFILVDEFTSIFGTKKEELFEQNINKTVEASNGKELLDELE